MVSSVSSASVGNAVSSVKIAKPDVAAVSASAVAKPVATQTGAKAVPTAEQLNAKAFLQRQQIGAALYDRSFTLKEGVSAMKRQDAIAGYAAAIQAKEGGPTAQDLAKLDRKLDRAETQITKLSTNAKGADIDSLEAIDGKELDTVQENLSNRINAGLKDGTLTKEEGESLLKRQAEINDAEVKLRESDGKLTAGEQKQLLDQLRKTADQINSARHNNTGVNLTYKTYSDQVDSRQASLEKQLATGIKNGSITEKEAGAIRDEMTNANTLEEELRADGKIEWKDSIKMSTALNDVEIKLYDLQRNKQGVQLADSYVDVKYADQRQAQQLENTARGISNKALTDDESVELLQDQQKIQNTEDRFVGDDGKLDRGEYLRLQNQMNDFSLRSNELLNNKDRWTGIMNEGGKPAVQTPVKPEVAVLPPAPPVKPEVAVLPPAPPVTPEVAVLPPAPPVKPEVAVLPPAPPVKPEVAVSTTPVPAASVETPTSAAPVAASAAGQSGPMFKAEAEEPSAKAPPRLIGSDVADLFGARMTGMMRESSDRLTDHHKAEMEKARERADDHRAEAKREEETRGPDDHKETKGFDGVRKYDDVRVAAYAKASSSVARPEAALTLKVA